MWCAVAGLDRLEPPRGPPRRGTSPGTRGSARRPTGTRRASAAGPSTRRGRAAAPPGTSHEPTSTSTSGGELEAARPPTAMASVSPGSPSDEPSHTTAPSAARSTRRRASSGAARHRRPRPGSPTRRRPRPAARRGVARQAHRRLVDGACQAPWVSSPGATRGEGGSARAGHGSLRAVGGGDPAGLRWAGPTAVISWVELAPYARVDRDVEGAVARVHRDVGLRRARRPALLAPGQPGSGCSELKASLARTMSSRRGVCRSLGRAAPRDRCRTAPCRPCRRRTSMNACPAGWRVSAVAVVELGAGSAVLISAMAVLELAAR